MELSGVATETDNNDKKRNQATMDATNAIKSILSSTFFVTTAPVATTAFTPTVTPGRMVASAPIQSCALTISACR